MKNKGFSLAETLITLVISATIILIFGYLMDKGIKMNRGAGINNDVLSGGLILQDSITKNMRYSATNLITIYKYNEDKKYGSNECWAIGFPVLKVISPGKITKKIDPKETGYNVDSYKCMGIMADTSIKKNWQGYMLYFHDKNGEYFLKKRNCFYEIKFLFENNKEKNRSILTRKTIKEWQKDVGIYVDSSNTDLFYKEVLKKLLKDVSTYDVKLISKSVMSFKISTNSYPAIKMGVLLSYGVDGGNVQGGRQIVQKYKVNLEAQTATKVNRLVTENFELNWTVLPLN